MADKEKTPDELKADIIHHKNRVGLLEEEGKNLRSELVSERAKIARLEDEVVALASVRDEIKRQAVELAEEKAALQIRVDEGLEAISNQSSLNTSIRTEMEAMEISSRPDVPWAVNDLITDGTDVYRVRDVYNGPSLKVDSMTRPSDGAFLRSFNDLWTKGFRKLGLVESAPEPEPESPRPIVPTGGPPSGKP